MEHRLLVLLSFFLIVLVLLVMFMRDALKKKKDNKQEINNDSLFTLIIPAIIASLVAQGLLSKHDQKSLADLSLTDLENYLIDQNIFSSTLEIQDWILQQPELVGFGDSIFVDQSDLPS